jgi:hypothetical protein
MFLNKVKVVLLVALVLAVLGAGFGLWNRPAATADPVERRREEVAQSGKKTGEEPVPAARATAVLQEVPRPIGNWERDVGPSHITLRIEGDHLYGTMTTVDPQKGGRLTIHLDGDYSVTRDSLLYGVITGVDTPEGITDENVADLGIYSDQPFSLRYRLDGNTLTLKDLKLGICTKEGDMKDVRSILGRYKKKTPPAREDNP